MKPKVDVLMVIEGEIATTQLIEQVLSACRPYGIEYRKILLAELTTDSIQRHTVPLFVRSGDPSLKLWIERLQEARHPYVYYIDDNFWKIEGTTPLAAYYRHPLVRQALEAAVGNAYQVLTNSHLLADFLRNFNESIKVLPASFDFSLLDQTINNRAEEVRIGFAGSPSRVDDLSIIQAVLYPVLDKHPDVIFEFVGTLPYGVLESKRVRFFPHMGDYESFIRFKNERNWAIGLAPLLDNEANRCKTNNKYREYGGCRVAGIYSDIPPYQGSVQQGRTGLLVANTTDAWIDAIDSLVLNPTLRTDIAAQAYDDVFAKHAIECVANIWADALIDVSSYGRRNKVREFKLDTQWIRAKKLMLSLESIWVRFGIVYTQGGLGLVGKKLLQRLTRFIT